MDDEECIAAVMALCQNAWQFDAAELLRARRRLEHEAGHWTLTDLAKGYLLIQMRRLDDAAAAISPVLSLAETTIDKLLQYLETHDSVESQIKLIDESLEWPVLNRLLHSERMPYLLLRSFIHQSKRKEIMEFDIDEAVLRHQRFLKSRSKEDNKDSKYLVTLQDLVSLRGQYWPSHPKEPQASFSHARQLCVIREEPKSGLQLFDHNWTDNLVDVPFTPDCQQKGFLAATRHVLEGLDWNNVVVLGDVALSVLCRHDIPNNDCHNSPIVIYIYGLGTLEAKSKVEQIHDVWARNVQLWRLWHNNPPLTQVVKELKRTIFKVEELIWPQIHIVHKLFASVSDVLVNCSLDAHALAFDGTQIVMSHRCARSIETGYSNFTMGLVCNENDGDSFLGGDSVQCSILDASVLGFGLRILPSYVDSLCGYLDMSKLNSATSPVSDESFGDMLATDNDISSASIYAAHRQKFASRREYRNPLGAEPPEDIVRRIMHLGEEYTSRSIFHDLSLISGEELPAYKIWHSSGISLPTRAPDISSLDITNDRNTTDGEADYRVGQMKAAILSASLTFNDPPAMAGFFSRYNRIARGACDGPGIFETLVRRHFFTRSTAAIGLESVNGRTYSDSMLSSLLFNRVLTPAIEQRVGVLSNTSRADWTGYLTRRIRPSLFGVDYLGTRKQIVLPVPIPRRLEDFIGYILDQNNIQPGAGLIPIYNSRIQNSTIPPLPEISGEEGNYRYWVVRNSRLWRGKRQLVDHVADVLDAISCYFCDAALSETSLAIPPAAFNGTNPALMWHVVCQFRRNLTTLLVPDVPVNHSSNRSGLPAKEALLFRSWIYADPVTNSRVLHPSDYRWSSVELDPFETTGFKYPEDLAWNIADNRGDTLMAE